MGSQRGKHGDGDIHIEPHQLDDCEVEIVLLTALIIVLG
jgi:hypothetical protein